MAFRIKKSNGKEAIIFIFTYFVFICCIISESAKIAKMKSRCHFLYTSFSKVMTTEIPVASLPPKKLQQLQHSTTDPRMYLFIDKFDLDPELNAVVYDIEVGIKKDAIVYVHTVQKRYSQLFEFDSLIRPLYKDNRYLQPFPPKKMFGNKSKEFLEQRAEALQRYLTNLVKVAGVVTTPHFCRIFEIDPTILDQ